MLSRPASELLTLLRPRVGVVSVVPLFCMEHEVAKDYRAHILNECDLLYKGAISGHAQNRGLALLDYFRFPLLTSRQGRAGQGRAEQGSKDDDCPV